MISEHICYSVLRIVLWPLWAGGTNFLVLLDSGQLLCPTLKSDY